jgi:hypothetical protein
MHSGPYRPPARCSLAVLFSIRADARSEWAERTVAQDQRPVPTGDQDGTDAYSVSVRFHRGSWRAGAAMSSARATLALQMGGLADGTRDGPTDRPVRALEAVEGLPDDEAPTLRAVG